MRNLVELLDVLIAQIPPQRTMFIKDLKHCQVQAAYSPPELMDVWNYAGEIINDYIKYPLEDDWENELIDIWTAKKDYKEYVNS